MRTVKTWDVIIIGGGIIGLSLAIALRKRGATVLVIERGEPGREASHAAGGMLVDCPLETPAALQELATASARMYPEFVHDLEAESGIKVDLRDQGTILFPSKEHPEHSLGESPQMRLSAIGAGELEQLEPALRITESNQTELEQFHQEEGKESTIEEVDEFFRSLRGQALRLKERSVDPRALAAAAVKAARHRHIDFSSGDEVTAVEIEHARAIGVKTAKTAFAARNVVNCAGAWAGSIAPFPLPTRPVKGQMLCLLMPFRTLLKHVVRSPKVYLIPRSDGRLLVGATVEEAGFDKRTDPDTIQRLHKTALALVPKLADARILEDWAGLRPGTPDALPILGATPISNYYVASGHFRDGILLAPITAQLMADVIEGRDPGFHLLRFSPSRFVRN
jgi:glycine/D-amino acid oxidase-like deaminating enzyme